MAEYTCPQCGAPLAPNATECKYCGEPVAPAQPAQPVQPVRPVQPVQPVQPIQQPYQQPYQQPVYPQPVNGINPAWPLKSKLVAGLLAIFLGGLGIHKFYLGKVGAGIVYLLFCWTYIPAIVGFIEGIVYLASNDYIFQTKHHVRLQ